MKYMGDMLLTKPAFSEIVMGNTALVRAMMEAGTRVVSAYPGSPTPEIATAINSIPADERPFYFEFSTNEKVATELALGASINGHLSTVFFKSVGLNVAADTFVQLNLLNLIGGMVIVLGDDPGANSSQNEQDNRHYSYMSYTPMLEPADPTEVYLFYKEAAKLSQKLRMPVIVRLSTHICHAKEKVNFDAWNPTAPDNTPRFDRKNGPYVPIAAPLVFPRKRQAFEKLEAATEWAEQTELNRIVDNQNPEYGVITSGLPFLSLMDVMEKTAKKPDILKLATAYPLPKKLTADFLKKHKRVKVLEELDNEMEKEIKSLAYDLGLSTKITGKMDGEDWIGEYTEDKVYDALRKSWPDIFPPREKRSEEAPHVGDRPPQMCPGCGHRSAFHAVKKALKDTDITVGDIGCHTLGFIPPYYMGEILICMGASPGIGSGLSLFNADRKVVVFMGDSTFFHAGLPGIVNSLFNNHNITMVLMENGTTAMTGHQEHPATGKNFNDVTDKIPVRQVLEGLGVPNIHEVDAYQQKKLIKLVQQATNEDKFSVVIAKHPCMLKFMREQRRKHAREIKAVDVNQDACQRINECVEVFACPTFSRSKDGEITTNKELCIGDGSCLQTCPTKAIYYPKK